MTIRIASVLTALLATTTGALAQDLLLEPPRSMDGWAGRSDPVGLIAVGSEWRGWLDFSGAKYKNTALAGRPGSLTVDRIGAALIFERPVDETSLWAFDLSYEQQRYSPNYNIGGLQRPVAQGDLWRIGLAWHDQSPENWSWHIGARVEGGVERSLEPWQAPALGANLGLDIELSDSLGLELSLDAFERLEDDPRLLPLALIDWQLDEDLRLGRVARGYGLEYSHDAATRFYVAAAYQERQYRLHDSDSGGVLRDEETALEAGMRWNPGRGTSLELFAGRAERHMALFDEGLRQDCYDVDSTPFVGFRLNVGPGLLP